MSPPKEDVAAIEDDSEALECRRLACTFLHECFVENPQLIRLIHFQGYDLSLLPHTVGGIEAMHVCMDVVAEMVDNSNKEAQVFAVNLAAHLALKYPVPRMVSVARLVIARARFWVASSGPGASWDHSLALKRCAKPLARICRTFPFLREEFEHLCGMLPKGDKEVKEEFVTAFSE